VPVEISFSEPLSLLLSRFALSLQLPHVQPRALAHQVSPPQFSAAWMSEPIADTENRAQVSKAGDKFLASRQGNLRHPYENPAFDGAILSGTLDNVVDSRERDCNDTALMNCGERRMRKIVRKIEITLKP